jgi:hypothetical protein
MSMDEKKAKSMKLIQKEKENQKSFARSSRR